MNFRDLIIFLFPAYFVFVGFISNMIKNKPIDKKYGYRTELSTKSKQNWYFANNFIARGAFTLALVFIVIGLILNNFIDMTRFRRFLFILIEFMSYVILGITLENRLKTAHKK